MTSTERRAVVEAATKAGAREAYVVKEPILAAIGAGIPIHEARGHMIVDIGGGTADVAVISLGGIVASTSVKCAGNSVDRAIADHIKKTLNLSIGDKMAEETKIRIGSAVPVDEEITMMVKGRDHLTGLPRSVELGTNEVVRAIGKELRTMVGAIKDVLQETPPELASDIIDNGIIMTGGSSQLRNLPELIFRRTGSKRASRKTPRTALSKALAKPSNISRPTKRRSFRNDNRSTALQFWALRTPQIRHIPFRELEWTKRLRAMNFWSRIFYDYRRVVKAVGLFFVLAGPGILVMVADNDAGGITTYAATGAKFGYGLLWFLVLLGPVAYYVQEMTVRLGAVTKRGHAEAIFDSFGSFWGWFSLLDLFLSDWLTLVTEFIGMTAAMSTFMCPPGSPSSSCVSPYRRWYCRVATGRGKRSRCFLRRLTSCIFPQRSWSIRRSRTSCMDSFRNCPADSRQHCSSSSWRTSV